MIPKKAIEKAISGLYRKVLPFLYIWYAVIGLSRGIKVSELRLYASARLVLREVAECSEIANTTSTSATATPTTFDATAVFSAIQRLKTDYGLLNLDGLANDLGITKADVTTLIKLCADAPVTRDGSRQYSPETITLVKNALFAARISKQTTSQYALPPSWMKNELSVTSKQWPRSAYGMSRMAAPSVVNVTAM